MSVRHLTTIAAAALACMLPACVQNHASKPRGADGGGLSIPIMPLAQGHIPPVWTPRPAGAQDAWLPIRIAGVSRRGRALHITWDAPGATKAIVWFSADGSTFRLLARTGEPAAEFVPRAPHGIIRVYVTDGKRHGSADYKL